MPRQSQRSWTWMPLLAGAALIVVIVLGEQPGRGQAAKETAVQRAQNSAPLTPSPTESGACRTCHDLGRNNNRNYSKAERGEMICRMTEVEFYDKGDKHQIAYAQLAGERSQNMIKLLGYKDKDATTVDSCVRCHALPEVGGTAAPETFRSEGVTCVVCHGAFQEWVDQHPGAVTQRRLRKQRGGPKPGEPKQWLDLTRQEKEDQKGMTDLWEPVRRTEICASCHIGSQKEKKVVTHAMYAAGHPPLPSFEPASFGDLQPAHWQYIREKDNAQRDRLKPFSESNLERAELVAVSGPIMLREVMKFYVGSAGAKKEDQSSAGAGWPDFARYDCRACHHELKSELRETAPDQAFAPRRPSEPKWVHVLARVGITGLTATAAAATKERARYETLVKELREAMSAEPFAAGGQVAKAASHLASWAEELVKNRPSSGVNQKGGWAMLAQICDEAVTVKALDYDSARQLAWAFRAVYQDVIPDAKQRNLEVERILNQLQQNLFMNLGPSGANQDILKSLSARLERAASFDRQATVKLFGELKALVAQK